MEAYALWIGVGVGLLGVLVGVLWTRREARRSARSQLELHLARAYEMDPAAFIPDLSHVLGLSFNGQSISNFHCLVLTVRLQGYRDYENPAARQPRQEGEPFRPRINFDNFRILAIGTQNNDPNVFQLPIGRVNNDRGMILNIIRLRAGAAAKFNILGTRVDRSKEVSARLEPGYVVNTEVTGAGMLT